MHAHKSISLCIYHLFLHLHACCSYKINENIIRNESIATSLVLLKIYAMIMPVCTVVEPTMSATVSESYSIRAQSELVSEFPSIVTVAPMAQPTSSLGYPAASDLYHTSALISSAASTVKSLYTQTGYQITSSNLHYTESPNYTYTTTAMSFSPQSSSETKTIHSSRSSLYVTRGKLSYIPAYS